MPIDAAAPTCDASGTEDGVAAAAAAAVDGLDFVGLTEHLHTSLCLFYFTYDLTAPFHRDCRGGSKAPVYNSRAGARADACPGRGTRVAEGNELDGRLYDHAETLFWARVAAMGRATAYEHVT